MNDIEQLESKLRTAELLEKLAYDVYIKATLRAQGLAGELINLRIRQEESNGSKG